MIIVYLSIALAVAALIFLGISIARTFKGIQPAVKSLSGTAAQMGKELQGIQHEVAQLKHTKEVLLHEMQKPKRISEGIITAAKGSLEELKAIWVKAVETPNPQKLRKVELSPEARRITDRLVNWFFTERKERT